MSPRKIAEQAHQFSATGTHTVVDMSTGPMSSFGLQAKLGAAVTAWTLLLEGTIDGTNWDTILTHTNVTPGDGKMIWTTVPKPCKKVRLNLSSLTGAGTLDCALLGVPVA